jgi:hypothetical protein
MSELKFILASDVTMRAQRRRGRCYVATDTTPVKVRGENLAEVWWRGRQWAVTQYGVEALDGTYVIAAERLDEHLSSAHPYGWPQQVGNKIWVDVEDFITAWLVGMTLHGVRAKPELIRAAIERSPPPKNPRPR